MTRTVSLGSLFILLLHVSLAFSDAYVKLRYEASGDGIAGWRPATDEGHAVDRETGVGGKPSLRMSRTPANQESLPFGCRWVSKPVSVVPGQAYTVCAQIRVAELEKGRVGFRVNFYADAQAAAAGAYTQGSEFGDVIYEDTDWTFAGFSFRAPEGASHAVVWLTAEKDFLGTVWFDQVHLFSGGSLPISEVEMAPKVDGDLGDSVWKQGLVCTRFHPVQQTSLQVETRVTLVISGDDLFVGAFCKEPDIDDLKQGSTQNHKSEIWTDDSLEVVVAPDPRTLDALKFVVNTLGKYSIFGPGGMLKNGPKVKAAVKKGRDFWTVEVRIPLAYFLKRVNTGADFNELAEREQLSRFLHVGLNRNRYAGIRSLLSWGPEQQYHNDSHERLVPVFRSSGIVPITANLDHWRWFEKKPGGGDYEGIRKPKAHIAKDPLYRELFSTTPRTFPRDVGFIWRPLHDWADAFALTFGMPYNRDQFADQIQKTGMHCFEYFWGSLGDCPRYGTKPELMHYLDGRGIKRVYYAAYHSPPGSKGNFPVLKKEWGYFQKYPAWVFDPDVEKLALADLERVIKANKGRLRGVCVGDECIMAYMNFGPDFFGALKTHPNAFKYPYIENAAREIRDKYGFGKFGPPQGMGDKNPFRWIAYHKWFLDTYARVAQNFRATAKSLDPDLLVISSEDPAYPFGRSRLAPFFDVMAVEMGPDRIPTADSFRCSFSTKRAVDACRPTPVWPVDHFENQFTANEVLALYSENLRVGAEGSVAWAPRGVCKRPGDTSRRSETDLWTLNEYYGHADTWNARFYAWEHMQDMPRLKYPKAECAVLQSITTANTAYKWTGLNLGIQEAGHTLLGPRAGVWFDFVEDLQVLDGKKRLPDYKVVFVPHAKYGTRVMAERFKTFVQQGGTLVIFDPEMFAFFDDGEPGKGFLADLAGVTIGDTNAKAFGGLKFRFTKEGASLFGQHEGGTLEIAEPENAFLVDAASEVRVLAADPEGNPLIIEKTTGKGRCIYFAANPCVKEITKDRKWIALFASFARNLGLKTGEDIWRFQLPLLPERQRPGPELTCLSGNHFQLWMYKYLQEHNAVTDGMRYRYSRAPDAVPDQGGDASTWIPLAKGDLTDRRQILGMSYESLLKPIIERWRIIKYKKGSPLPEDAWLVAYNPGPGFDVTFDLTKTCQIRSIRMVYQGYRPAMTAEVSDDAANWRAAGSADQQMVTHVAEERFEWPNASGRYLKLSFADLQQRLSLAEIEVWGTGEGIKLDEPGTATASGPDRTPAAALGLGQNANLLSNADFEAAYEPAAERRLLLVDKRGWTMEGELLPESWNVNFHGKQACYVKVDEANPHGGKYCLKVRGMAGKPVDFVLSEHIPISAAPVKLRARIWARGKGTFHTGVFAYGHRKGTGWDRIKSPLPLTPQWKQYTVDLNVTNPEAVKISFFLQPVKDAEAPEAWFDDLNLEVAEW